MILWFICVEVTSLSQVIFAFQKKKKEKQIFAFRLYLGMVMYGNEVATKENKNYLR